MKTTNDGLESTCNWTILKNSNSILWSIVLLLRAIALDIRKNFFTARVAKIWKALPREVVEFPPLELSKEWLEKTFSGLVVVSQRVDLMLEAFSNFNGSMILSFTYLLNFQIKN